MKSIKKSVLGVRYLSIIFFLMIVLSTMIVAVPSEVEAKSPLVRMADVWSIETVDINGDVGFFTSIAIDSSDRSHISYWDSTNGDLKYATNADGSWVTNSIDSNGDVGYYPSIAIDSNDNVHISYWDRTNGDLKYATNAGGTWSTSTIDSEGFVGATTSIALDSNGKVHISYYDATNFDLKYATNAGGTWSNSTIDSAGDVGWYSSIALDSSGKVHISYYDGTNLNLKYATNTGGSWDSSTIDSAGNVGAHTSIALDSNDKVHISYDNSTTSDLKYATNAGGTWSASTIDSAGYVGGCTSIALDSNGKAHISYYDSGNGDLKYATNAGGTWSASAIDSAGNVGKFSSIALDSNDKPHFSYRDITNGDLKYATPATLPSAPTLNSATPYNAQIILVWTAPNSNGGSAITNYTVYRSTTSGGETLLTTVGNVLTYADTGLTNGQTYYYTVSAINSVGEGPQSNETSATPVTVPTAPLGFQVVSGDSAVDLNWTAPEYIGLGTITYHLFRDGSSIWNGTGLTYTDSGLTNGVNYSYDVAAQNSVGWGMNSTQVQATPVTVPSAPTLSYTQSDEGQVVLVWTTPSDGGATITNYTVYRGTTSGEETLLLTLGNVLIYTDTGLTNGQIYYYKVSAVNSFGEGLQSNELNATPIGPPTAPQNLQASPGDVYINLTWQAPASNGGSAIINYEVWKGRSSGAETFLTDAGLNLWFNNAGLTNGQTYYYKVRAENAQGLGPNSSEANATPIQAAGVPSAPQNLTVTAGNSVASLSWNPPSSNGSAALSGYRIYRGTSLASMTLLGTVSLTTYTDTSLTNGQIYYYRVCAYSSAGNGTMTDPLDAKPNGVSGADNALLYVGIGAIAIVAVAGAAMVMMRRRKP